MEKSAAQKAKPPPRENVNPLDSLLELELPPRPEGDDVEDEVKEKADKTTTEATKEKKKKKKRRKTTTTEAPTTTTEATTRKSTTEVWDPLI